MIYAQIPDATDPYVPHQVMLDVTYVDAMVCLEIVDRTEDGTTTTCTSRDGASILVDINALMGVLWGMVNADHNHKVRSQRGDLDANFYNGYKSPTPAPPPTQEGTGHDD